MKSTKYLVTVTEKGIIKISSMEEIKEQGRAGCGIKVCSVGSDSGHVVDALVIDGLKGSLLVVASSGRGIRFAIKDLRVMGRTASGVRAIRIKESEKVVSVNVV